MMMMFMSFRPFSQLPTWMITISKDYVIMVIKIYNIKSNNNMQKNPMIKP
jgi:hypothetical protein